MNTGDKKYLKQIGCAKKELNLKSGGNAYVG